MPIEAKTVGLVFDPVAAPTVACHAATLLPLGDGNMMCAWFAGSREGAGDTRIWLSLRRGGGWSAPECVAKVTPEAHWNPVLFLDAREVHLFFKVGPSPRAWRTYRMTRALGGCPWSEPQELVPGDVGGRGPVKNKPIKLGNGDWLAPASIETKEVWDCFVDRSSDRGQSWRRSEFVPLDHAAMRGRGIIQPTLWESGEGRVHMLARSTAGRIYRSDSQDSGETWSPAYATQLPNNNSGIDLVRLDDGTLILAYNPVDQDGGPRTPLYLAVSRDNGIIWAQAHVLEDEPGGYSYPAVVKTDRGFSLSYTWRRRSIKFWEFAWS